MMFKVPPLGLALLAGVYLTACASNAPSDFDIRAAYEKAYAGEYSTEVGGPMLINGAQSSGCKEVGQNAFTCNVLIELSRGGELVQVPAALKLIKGSNGWRLAA